MMTMPQVGPGEVSYISQTSPDSPLISTCLLATMPKKNAHFHVAFLVHIFYLYSVANILFFSSIIHRLANTINDFACTQSPSLSSHYLVSSLPSFLFIIIIHNIFLHSFQFTFVPSAVGSANNKKPAWPFQHTYTLPYFTVTYSTICSYSSPFQVT